MNAFRALKEVMLDLQLIVIGKVCFYEHLFSVMEKSNVPASINSQS